MEVVGDGASIAGALRAVARRKRRWSSVSVREGWPHVERVAVEREELSALRRVRPG
ncbi:hypothetical protein ENSA5_53930 [Enhygromyxa salina]|uniref:Uncharacterized protein n=1 Tax=Enhygromyxa salina TaxID=215803 RepID=A0A2S9XFJ4_9BACT|nr:hypothetical protein ENSA5_53930 [Enhygromyxa salina]